MLLANHLDFLENQLKENQFLIHLLIIQLLHFMQSAQVLQLLLFMSFSNKSVNTFNINQPQHILQSKNK